MVARVSRRHQCSPKQLTLADYAVTVQSCHSFPPRNRGIDMQLLLLCHLEIHSGQKAAIKKTSFLSD